MQRLTNSIFAFWSLIFDNSNIHFKTYEQHLDAVE